ncbi:MAG: flagellum-specific ATP synthase FliI, partial [Pseudomonadota bacterium]
MPQPAFAALTSEIASLQAHRRLGRVASVDGGVLRVSGLSTVACVGDRLSITRIGQPPLMGEVLQLAPDHITMLP